LRRVSPLRLFFSRPESGAIAGAVIVFLIFGVLSALRGDIGKGFLSIQGAASYLEIAAQVGILGAAVSLLMIAGEFDLSVGSMIGASGLLLGLLIVQFGVPPTIAIILTFAFALAVGAFNGWIRIKTGLPSFIVTLGMLRQTESSFSLRFCSASDTRTTLLDYSRRQLCSSRSLRG